VYVLGGPGEADEAEEELKAWCDGVYELRVDDGQGMLCLWSHD
jgi:putative component of toxin-antitoxin plasmid stabilization module